ncbi:MAG: O-antigen ligase family protein, partial [Anaerolineae bacterium]|nr:O-antigen ligase family protein [Anaerolineae bacterium]
MAMVFAAAGTAGICLAGWLVSQTNWLVTARPLQENTIAVPGTLNLRMEVWSRAVSAIRDFSWTGMGMNLFRTTSESMYPLFLIDPSRDIAHAHNEFLQAALDLGIAGLVAFLALNLAAVIMLRRLWLRLPAVAQFLHPLQDAPLISRAVVLGLAGGLISHMIYGMADAVGLGAKPGVLFWLLIALVTALYIRVSLPNIPVQDQRV